MFRFFGNANQVYGCVIPRLIKRDAPDRHECWVRGAMDALVCGDEARWRGRQKRVVPISRRWDQPLGLKSPGGRWLKSPDTGESAL